MVTQPTTILCVEDEPTIRSDIAEELREQGYRVLEAGDGEQALQIVSGMTPDLVLCDIHMPRMDGRELLRRLRAMGGSIANLPFIFLTAYGEKRDIITARALGVDDYMVKPVDFDLLLSMVHSRLASRERARRDLELQLGMFEQRYLQAVERWPGIELPGRAVLLQQLGAGGRRRSVLLVAPTDLHLLRAQFGIDTADALMHELADHLRRLKGSDPEGPCRLAHDVLALAIDTSCHNEDLRQSLLQLGNFELLGGGRRLSAPCNVVLAACQDPAGGERVLDEAMLALRYARLERSSELVVLDVEVRQRVQIQQHVERHLQTAIGNGELTLHYQPTVRLRDRRVVGMEALIRWNSPQLGLISPATFIPMAERLGVIESVTDWCLTQACKAIRRLDERGFQDRYVAVNVSGLEVRERFSERIRRARAAYAVEPQRLLMEITETAMMSDMRFAAELTRNLRADGVRVAIDDFGSGYASLNYLRELAVDAVKIDRSFVQGIALSGFDRQVCESIVQLARTINVMTIGEGVETAAEACALAETGCEIAQGYHFGRPMPLERLLELPLS